MITIKEIQNAFENIRPFVHRTPLIYSRSLSSLTGAEVYLKAENLQKTGSFKVRGAFNKMLRLQGDSVIAASMGNHAQAVAFAARTLGVRATIVMPVNVPIIKEEATRGYGAEVVLSGETFQSALEYALSRKGYSFIHAFDDEDVIAGQGTIAIEILQELQDIDALFVPVGGGGLISGISLASKALSPGTRIIGVQTTSAISAYLSFKNRRLTDSPPSPTLADGIAVGRIGEKAFAIIERYVDDILAVDEDAIALAILMLLERKKLVVEGAGAVPLAALLGKKEVFSGKRVVLVVSGGNIDFTLIDRIIHKGLVASGRIGVLEAVVDDTPGSLHTLTGIIASRRGTILNIVHDRLSGGLPVGKTMVTCTIEIRGKKDLEELLSDFRKRGFEVRQRK